MAEPVLLSNMAVWLGGYDHSAELNTCNFTVGNAELGDATFGDVLAAEHPGILMPRLGVAGRWSAGSGAPDPINFSRMADKSAWPVTLCPPNAPAATPGTDGNLSYDLVGAQFSYQTWGRHGELLPFRLSTLARSGGTVSRGTVMLPKASVVATTTGTARQLGALSSTQQMVAVFHMFSVTGGSWVLTVESDNGVGFGTPAVQATFTAATGVTRQVVKIAGPVTDDWWRVVLTKTGGTSCIPAATLGIVPIP